MKVNAYLLLNLLSLKLVGSLLQQTEARGLAQHKTGWKLQWKLFQQENYLCCTDHDPVISR